MHVDVMDIPADQNEGSSDGRKMLLKVDNETLITVLGFGTGEYRWKVEYCGRDPAGYDPMGLLPWQKKEVESFMGEAVPVPCPSVFDGDWLIGEATLGLGLVWIEPLTFAHVVMDLINNQ